MTDILDKDAVGALAWEFADAEILVVTAAMLVRKTIADHTEDEFARQIALNLKAAFFVAQAFGSMMTDGGQAASLPSPAFGPLLWIRGPVFTPGPRPMSPQFMLTLAAEVAWRACEPPRAPPGGHTPDG